jgi:hypothetical protein
MTVSAGLDSAKELKMELDEAATNGSILYLQITKMKSVYS